MLTAGTKARYAQHLLTFGGLGARYKQTVRGPMLGMASSDFHCGLIGRIWICTPQNPRAMSVIKDLQQIIRNISTMMSAAGRLDVPKNLATLDVDGRVGPTTALGAQFVAAAFAGVVAPSPEIKAILDPNLTAQQVINQVALNADGLVLFFASTLANFPKAISADPIVVIKEPPRKVPTAQAAVVGIGLLSTISGLLASAAKGWLG